MPSISAAEWIVMEIVWERGEATANQVVEALADRMHWKAKTIQTLLRRLLDKGALSFEKRGREYVFQPLVPQKDCQWAESRSFLDRVYGGGLAPFLASFFEQEKLSPTQIAELKEILDRQSS